MQETVISPHVIHSAHRTWITISGLPDQDSLLATIRLEGATVLEKKATESGEIRLLVDPGEVKSSRIGKISIPGDDGIKEFEFLILSCIVSNMSYIPPLQMEEEKSHPFLCGIFEVSGDIYRQFLNHVITFGDTVYSHPAQPPNKDHTPDNWHDTDLQQGNKPVTGVDYFDAYACCAWLGMRLPTAEEWKLATFGDETLTFPWGNEFKPAYAACSETVESTQLINSHDKGKSRFGLHHACGNVWEIIEPGNPDDDEIILKGGSYLTSLLQSVGSSERKVNRLFRSPDIGFRCAMDMQEYTVEQTILATWNRLRSQAKAESEEGT